MCDSGEWAILLSWLFSKSWRDATASPSRCQSIAGRRPCVCVSWCGSTKGYGTRAWRLDWWYGRGKRVVCPFLPPAPVSFIQLFCFHFLWSLLWILWNSILIRLEEDKTKGISQANNSKGLGNFFENFLWKGSSFYWFSVVQLNS